MYLTINLKNPINLKSLIISLVSKDLFRLMLLLKQEIIRKGQVYRVYKNVTNTIIIRFYISYL